MSDLNSGDEGDQQQVWFTSDSPDIIDLSVGPTPPEELTPPPAPENK
jgi:hypothetical protein